jgi:hypothetical protein
MKPPQKSLKERKLEALALRLEEVKATGRLVGRKEIRVQKPIELFAAPVDPADKKLPAAPGGKLRKAKPSDAESLLLEQTKIAGGLIHHSAKIGKPTRATPLDMGPKPYKTLADIDEAK